MAEKIPSVRGLTTVVSSNPSSVPTSEAREERVAFVSGARIIFFALLIATTILARDVLLLIFLSVMISFALSYPVGLMSRKMPRGLAVILSLILVLGALTGLGVATAPVLSKQVQSVRKTLPTAVGQFKGWADQMAQKTSDVAPQAAPGGAQGGKVQEQLNEHVGRLIDSGVGKIFPAAIGALTGISGAILILVLAAFLVHQPEVYVRGARLLVPKKSESAYDEGAKRIAFGLRRWIGGIGLAMLIMGLCTAIGLKIAGIDNWLLLGILTAFGTFIPYLGAICSAVPGVLMGLSQSPHHFFYACLVYLCVHIIEGYIVQPFIMRRAVEVRPALLLVGQAVFGALLGLPGVVVASPLLVCLQIAIGYYYVERKLGKTAAI